MERYTEKQEHDSLIEVAKILEDGGASGPQIAKHLKNEGVDIKSTKKALKNLGYLSDTFNGQSLIISLKHEDGRAVHPMVEVVSWEESEN